MVPVPDQDRRTVGPGIPGTENQHGQLTTTALPNPNPPDGRSPDSGQKGTDTVPKPEIIPFLLSYSESPPLISLGPHLFCSSQPLYIVHASHYAPLTSIHPLDYVLPNRIQVCAVHLKYSIPLINWNSA